MLYLVKIEWLNMSEFHDLSNKNISAVSIHDKDISTGLSVTRNKCKNCCGKWKFPVYEEAYLGPYEISMMDLLAVNNFRKKSQMFDRFPSTPHLLAT